MQSAINLQDFQDAEPDFLVHSTSAIVERFSAKGIRCDVALKALCKKKGLHVEVTIMLPLSISYSTWYIPHYLKVVRSFQPIATHI